MAEPTWLTGVEASVAGANKKHLTIWNGAGSGKVVKVYLVKAAGAPTAAVTGQVIPLVCKRITSAPTGGTNPGFAAAAAGEQALPAQITVTAAATGGAAETGPILGAGTVSGEETSMGAVVSLIDFEIEGTKPVELAEGQGLVVRQGALASAGAVNISAVLSVV